MDFIQRIAYPIGLLMMVLSVACTTTTHTVRYPEPVRENIEWCRVWMPHANQNKLPRVLLIGDSFTVGYFSGVEERLEDVAYVGYLATSRSVCDPIFFDELQTVLKQYDYEVVHFNNGLHGWGYSEEQYRQGLQHFLQVLRSKAPNAQLIWAQSTPHDIEPGQTNSKNRRIHARNQIARQIMGDAGIPMNDLYKLCIHRSELYSGDNVHFNNNGKELQAGQAASLVRERL